MNLRTQDDKEFIKLGWVILEHRIRYYHMDMPIIADAEYDILERSYLRECETRGVEASACRVGIDMNRPSVRCAYNKIILGG